ncbi:MAG: hypothetical protein LBV55_03105 [Acholeplasmatales bacterium]|jgi:hypothetical protein|nr:hypothetical protein [Acholeplasmatales bacterium]
MRKILALVLILLVGFVAFSCGTTQFKDLKDNEKIIINNKNINFYVTVPSRWRKGIEHINYIGDDGGSYSYSLLTFYNYSEYDTIDVLETKFTFSYFINKDIIVIRVTENYDYFDNNKDKTNIIIFGSYYISSVGITKK